ncbi:hypothetical protein M758_12G048700 [Ceratodon purpureus]|uniref:RRM domain-containing protein n=1 Tax=Ceratodon purpureus TaxID=3225 RepID=A0A8T0G766_CERPU|nr:hypothetical protein KC19_12G046000 [Ceratodon purpureus]KAG0553880.1 hypothetical protein KC19_12G046000 [Ceratodon purpureus]KAG0598133.1 hypothetical protein M758_12G048700 [Ceratodon purpureus]KAG0598134.1 hypothetical protein M758_12G048700 [Ceratodon purpureus]
MQTKSATQTKEKAFQGLGFKDLHNHARSLPSFCSARIPIAVAMAAATVSIAIATTRFAALSSHSATNFTRNGALSRLGASAACSLSCSFNAFSVVKRNGMNAALVARAAEIGNGEVATEEFAAPEPEELVSGDFAPEAPVVEVRSEVQFGSKLYVGNLLWTIDSEQLAEVLMEIGAVEAVEVIYDQETGRSRGFAFVTMASNKDARAVVEALDGSDLEGRQLRVTFPKPSKNNPRVFNPGRSRPGNVNKMFVGNLSWACDQEGLFELFSDYGKVVEAKVVYDKETGRSRGFGFVTMDSAAEVDAAIANLHETDYLGRLLRVDKVEIKPPPRQE